MVNLDSSLAAFLKYAGYLMAGVFLAAIVLDISGTAQSVMFARIGIVVAIAIPIAGIVIALVILLKKNETKYGLIAIILLIFILIAAIWRLFS